MAPVPSHVVRCVADRNVPTRADRLRRAVVRGKEVRVEVARPGQVPADPGGSVPLRMTGCVPIHGRGRIARHPVRRDPDNLGHRHGEGRDHRGRQTTGPLIQHPAVRPGARPRHVRMTGHRDSHAAWNRRARSDPRGRMTVRNRSRQIGRWCRVPAVPGLGKQDLGRGIRPDPRRDFLCRRPSNFARMRSLWPGVARSKRPLPRADLRGVCS